MTSRRWHPLLLLGLALLLSPAAPASAAAPQWVRTNLFGGSISALAQAPSAPRTLYAAAPYSTGEMFRSTDGGATWHRRGRLPSFPIELTVHPHDPETVCALTYSASLYRTRDGGITWTRIGADLPYPYVEALAWAGGARPVLLAATWRGLFGSVDGGDHWQVTGFEGSSVLGVATEPGAGSLFAMTGQDQDGAATVWKSTDQGATWVAVSVIPGRVFWDTLPHFTFDPVRPGTLYAWFFDFDYYYSQGPLYRSRDGGATWAELTPPPFLLDLVPLPDGTLLAGLDTGGVLRSDDLGDTWSPHDWENPVPDASILRIVTFPGKPGTVLAAGQGGLWASTDNGASWSPSNQGLAAVGVASLAVGPAEPSFIVAQTDSGFYRSTDQGATWLRVHSEAHWGQPWEIEAVAPRHPWSLYGFGEAGHAFNASGLFRSTTGGRRWRELPVSYASGGSSRSSSWMTAFALDPQDPEVLFVGGSYDFHYQGKGDFLVRSDDAFATETDLTPLHGLRVLVIAPGENGALYGLTCKRLYRSQDGARTWQRVGRGLPARKLCPREGWSMRGALVIDPRDPRRLYVGTAGEGVYASTDGGATFRAMNRGLETARVTTLLIDPADSTKLYAGTAEQGVFRWSAERRKWLPLNNGLPRAQYRGLLAIDPTHPAVLYAGASSGIFRIDLDEVPLDE